ncbi:hypothetical protein O181_117329 [Austropuccinia psidii MF-1]|uniref:Integrase zinc-binding domain-containing protein n=1 Tax=Austropuccinia psidii MF-1 TaxID=1389203 RepID=A0A9Q3KD40_9BASI|nr:hypothetical protein [Austropuccinia psidii MF-1]
MTIVHKAGNIHNNEDGSCRWALPNKSYNPAYVPTGAETQIQIEGINITDVGTNLFEEVRERSKHTCVMVLCSRMLIKTILLEFHDNIYSGDLSEDRTMERIKTCSWWPSWRKDVIEYCHSFDRCQKVNKATGKRFGLMIHIQEPSTPWEVAHMDWVTSLPPGGDKSYNACLVIVDRYSKTPIFLPCHKDDTSMDTTLFLFGTELYLILLLGKKLLFSTAYHPQTDGLAERTIQTLEEMIRGFCAYGLEFKHSDGFTHDWCTLIPALELAYKTSIHSSTGKPPSILEKRWNPKLPVDTLKI